jgi:Ca2+-binding EF-hand superfamily protein
MSAKEALNHPWILKNAKKPEPNLALVERLFSLRKKTEFQHLNMLIMSELLTWGKLEFVQEAKNTFLAINKSDSGELTY